MVYYFYLFQLVILYLGKLFSSFRISSIWRWFISWPRQLNVPSMSSLTQLIAPMTCVKGGVKAILFGLAFDNNRIWRTVIFLTQFGRAPKFGSKLWSYDHIYMALMKSTMIQFLVRCMEQIIFFPSSNTMYINYNFVSWTLCSSSDMSKDEFAKDKFKSTLVFELFRLLTFAANICVLCRCRAEEEPP